MPHATLSHCRLHASDNVCLWTERMFMHVYSLYVSTCSTALGTSPTGGFGTSTTAAASDACACTSTTTHYTARYTVNDFANLTNVCA
jgi:hypothetical protein